MACIFKNTRWCTLPSSSSYSWHSLGADLLKCSEPGSVCTNGFSNIWVLKNYYWGSQHMMVPRCSWRMESRAVPRRAKSHCWCSHSESKEETESITWIITAWMSPSFPSLRISGDSEGRDLIWDVWEAVPLLHFASGIHTVLTTMVLHRDVSCASLPPSAGDIWQGLETLLIVTTWESYWNPANRGNEGWKPAYIQCTRQSPMIKEFQCKRSILPTMYSLQI